MKVLYFDCSSGISGNMTLGALLELCDDPEYLEKELNKLHVDGYHMHISKAKKNGITGTYVDVHLEHDHHDHEHHHHEHDHHHHHDHEHHHEHRNLFDVNKIIDDSDIDEKAKDLAKRIFMRVALAESKVHNETLENVHFHEVGAIDSIVDIVGTAILITYLDPDKIYSSIINDGHGFIECAHGMISVPVPATSEIFAASQAMTRQIDIDTELVTPTGAAIISELACSYGVQPPMNVNKIGWGCGSKELSIPNVLKVTIGEMKDVNESIIVIETNIDDCTAEILSYTMEKLLDNGALDVFFTPIFMKKNRPAYRLTVSCLKKDIDMMKDIIFKETTTIGMRYREENRFVLKREIIERKTSLGNVHFKVCSCDDEKYYYPEFEDLKGIAVQTGIPLKEVYKKILEEN